MSIQLPAGLQCDPIQMTEIAHHSHTDRTYSHHLRQQSAIPLSTRLLHDTRVAKFGGVIEYVLVSGA